ncbi:hypothetical protein Trydic_g12848 [Trypoxylus dichotomus]
MNSATCRCTIRGPSYWRDAKRGYFRRVRKKGAKSGAFTAVPIFKLRNPIGKPASGKLDKREFNLDQPITSDALYEYNNERRWRLPPLLFERPIETEVRIGSISGNKCPL